MEFRRRQRDTGLAGARRFAVVLLAGILAVAPLSSTSEAGEIDTALQRTMQRAQSGQLVSVIITLKEKADLAPLRQRRDLKNKGGAIVSALRAVAARSQGGVTQRLRNIGAKRLASLWLINGVAAQIPVSAVAQLAASPEVESIRLDRILSVPTVQTAAAVAPEWNLDSIQAPQLWNLGYRGQGVIVANMDTGVDMQHPDLSTKWRGGGNSWFDPNGEHATPYDADGHGTSTMGVMVGGTAGGTAIGVAPDAKWIAVKIFNDDGAASYTAIHQGFQWLLDPDGNLATDDAPDVVNGSWTLSVANQCVGEFQADIEALKAAGIAFVAAAGNFGPGGATSTSPANYANGLSVGAVDAGLVVADFSSRGPSACDATIFPKVTAPGVNIDTTDLSFGGFAFYRTVSGTSLAAPHVAGAIALLRSAAATATVVQIETALTQSTIDLLQIGPDNDSGYGHVDVLTAFNTLVGAGVPIDGDHDGFVAALDCNDTNPAVFPGAAEVKRDGIDQDCNGYDLTIVVVAAAYTKKRDTLTVKATSSLGAAAALTVAGYGPMTWSPRKKLWLITVRPAGGNPGAVSVVGVEGAQAANTAVRRAGAVVEKTAGWNEIGRSESAIR